MVCDVAEPSAVATGKRCRNCGVVKPLSSFHSDSTSPEGIDGRCRSCRNAAGRRRSLAEASQRLPAVLGVSDAAELSTSLLGVLRTQYDGRPARMLDDLRRTLAESDPADRLNAMLTLLALRELAELSRSIGERARAIDALRTAPPD